MKNLITTIRNIFKIEDLRVRILNTFLFLLIYRIGTFVVLPGIDPNKLAPVSDDPGILSILNMFAGGAFSRGSVFALGIMPYISASIVVQLLTMAVPTFQKMQKEGEDGRRKINQITRYLTIAITVVQAVSYLINLNSETPGAIIANTNPAIMSTTMFMITSVICITAGTMFVLWLGEKITDKGLGNGISLIIMIGIIARLPFALKNEFMSRLTDAGGGLVIFLVEIVVLLLIVGSVVLLVQGVRKIPVQFAKRVVNGRQMMSGGARQYVPLKVNAAGVMPIIFAQALMFIPTSLGGFFPESSMMQGVTAAFGDYTSFAYNATFAVLIILFTFFYTAISVNPNQIAEDMKRNGGFIPGVKPGKATADFVDTVLSRITLPGALFLAIIAILPSMAVLFGIDSQFAQFFGGSSLLIMVGVVLDTLQQIESHLLMRHYDGLMKSGRIKGRTAAA
jgi:preprotein translocase subunit SecY